MRKFFTGSSMLRETRMCYMCVVTCALFANMPYSAEIEDYAA